MIHIDIKTSTQAAVTCRFCRRPIKLDPAAYVDLYVTADLDEICTSCPEGELVDCVDCGGTGNDPDVPEYEYCSYCRGAKTVPWHQPAKA